MPPFYRLARWSVLLILGTLYIPSYVVPGSADHLKSEDET